MDRYTETGEASRLQWAREYLGFSHEQVAEAVGWPVAVLVALEAGDEPITAGQLRALAAFYHRPPGWFTGDFEFEPGENILRMVEGLHPGDREVILDFAEYLQCKSKTPEIVRPREGER